MKNKPPYTHTYDSAGSKNFKEKNLKRNLQICLYFKTSCDLARSLTIIINNGLTCHMPNNWEKKGRLSV
jgi:hypothetical protein